MTEPSRAKREEREGPAIPRYGRRILLAEDSPVNQMVAKKLLGIFGCEVEVAECGEDALALWEKGGFDLVFLDCRMPGMDGYEAARAIRTRESRGPGRVPIIALTAETTLDERQWCIEAGMDDFLPKPITADALGAVLSRWLSLPARAAAPSAAAPPGAGGPALRLEALAAFIGVEGDSEEVLENMVELFLALIPPKIAALREAAGRGDGPAAEELAHSLKSSCYAMGAWRMGDICDLLERMGREESLGEGPAQVESLEREFARAREELARKPWRR